MFDLLSQEQIIVIATALIIQVIKIIWVQLLKKPKPSKGATRFIVFAVAVPLAYFVGDFGVPAFSEDPMQFAITLIASAGEVLLFAHVLYVAISEGVFEWLDAKLLGGRKALAP